MFAADTDVHIGTCSLTELDSHFHQLANACLVELSEGIVLEDLSVIVSVKELACVITREAVCHLCKVVCTEAEELSFLSDFVSCKSSSGDLDHCTNFILEVSAGFLDNSVSCFNNEVLNVLELLNIANQRNHDFRNDCPVGVILLNV